MEELKLVNDGAVLLPDAEHLNEELEHEIFMENIITHEKVVLTPSQ